MRCCYCDQVIAAGYPIYKLTYEPVEWRSRLGEHRPLEHEPIIGYACSLEHGQAYMRAQHQTQNRLRMVHTLTPFSGEDRTL